VFRTILVPTDFSPCSRQAYGTAAELAVRFDGKIVLMTVVDQRILDAARRLGLGPKRTVEAAALKETKRLFTQFAKAIRGRERIREEAIVFGAPDAEIAKKAREISADLIVMGSHGKTGPIDYVLFGSTAEKIVRMAPCPVLTVPL
jgi:nucleotide-binding universal stress UspA family protein